MLLLLNITFPLLFGQIRPELYFLLFQGDTSLGLFSFFPCFELPDNFVLELVQFHSLLGRALVLVVGYVLWWKFGVLDNGLGVLLDQISDVEASLFE